MFSHAKTFRKLVEQAIYHTENSMTSTDEENNLRIEYTSLARFLYFLMKIIIIN